MQETQVPCHTAPSADLEARRGRPSCVSKRVAIGAASGAIVAVTVFLCVYFIAGDGGRRGSGSGSGSASVTMQMRNTHGTTSTRRLLANSGVDPYYIGVKLIAVYVAHDIDPQTGSNVGGTSMIWLNTDCGDSIRDCTAESIRSFFNFTQSTAEINQRIGEQKKSVGAGIYKYVRMEFCKFGVQANNWEFLAPGMNQTFGFMMNECTVTAPINPPMELVAGSQVYVTLEFNPAGSVFRNSQSSGNSNCDSAGFCLSPPDFIPKAQLQPQ